MPYYGPRSRPSPTKVRDTQRSKVYAAEGAIPTGQRFKTVPEMQAYVDRFLASAWARRRWGNRQVTVNPGFGHRRATGGNGNVHMPVWARDEKTLLHEVGHNLAGADAWHDPRFVRVMVEIVGHVFGKDALAAFRKAIREERVKVGPALTVRPAEKTPPAPVVVTPKLWRFEFKQKGALKQTQVEAATLVSALARFVTLQQRSPSDGEITNLRAWRGVRQSVKRAAKAPGKRAARTPARSS